MRFNVVAAISFAVLLNIGQLARAEGPAPADGALFTWVEQAYAEELAAKPILRMSLGLPGHGTAWDDLSDERSASNAALAQRQIAELNQRFPDAQLAAAGRLNKRLYLYRLRQRVDRQSCVLNVYPMNHYDGAHFDPVTVLVSRQEITSERDALDYLERLKSIPRLLNQLQAAAQARAKQGHHAPRFSLLRLAKETSDFSAELNRPAGDGNTLLDDFTKKVSGVALSRGLRDRLLDEAGRVLSQQIAPAYSAFSGEASTLAGKSPGDFGAGAQPDGDRCYRTFLKLQTTLDLEPEQVHALGLSELRQLQSELLDIARKQGHQGSLREFVDAVRTSPQAYFPDDEAGRAAYLEAAKREVQRASAAASKWFRETPKAPLEVRRVEAYREGSVGTAFYEQPSADGKRPGAFYANLRSTKLLPKYQIEVLVHHEGIPGHHIQVGLAYENKSLPSFRRFDEYTAYTEGWGLYAEALPKDYGFYVEPSHDVGRLALDLRRAARLSVDTGIHALGWSREQAVEFMLANTADSEPSIRDEVDRYFVTPGQATAYKVGALELARLRAEMARSLGTRFDIRDFHRAVLGEGTLPLPVLRDAVAAYGK